MLREPKFFSKTLFVVDAFHAKGHTRCGRAAFLTNYCDTDPALMTVNSSAAECGNSGILRIRKSVSSCELHVPRPRYSLYEGVYLTLEPPTHPEARGSNIILISFFLIQISGNMRIHLISRSSLK